MGFKLVEAFIELKATDAGYNASIEAAKAKADQLTKVIRDLSQLTLPGMGGGGIAGQAVSGLNYSQMAAGTSMGKTLEQLRSVKIAGNETEMAAGSAIAHSLTRLRDIKASIGDTSIISARDLVQVQQLTSTMSGVARITGGAQARGAVSRLRGMARGGEPDFTGGGAESVNVTALRAYAGAMSQVGNATDVAAQRTQNFRSMGMALVSLTGESMPDGIGRATTAMTTLSFATANMTGKMLGMNLGAMASRAGMAALAAGVGMLVAQLYVAIDTFFRYDKAQKEEMKNIEKINKVEKALHDYRMKIAEELQQSRERAAQLNAKLARDAVERMPEETAAQIDKKKEAERKLLRRETEAALVPLRGQKGKEAEYAATEAMYADQMTQMLIKYEKMKRDKVKALEQEGADARQKASETVSEANKQQFAEEQSALEGILEAHRAIVAAQVDETGNLDLKLQLLGQEEARARAKLTTSEQILALEALYEAKRAKAMDDDTERENKKTKERDKARKGEARPAAFMGAEELWKGITTAASKPDPVAEHTKTIAEEAVKQRVAAEKAAVSLESIEGKTSATIR